LTRVEKLKYNFNSKLKTFANMIENTLGRKVFASLKLADICSFTMAIVFTAVTTWYNILQHYSFKTYAFDLGIYLQALYTTAFKGMILYETPDIFFTKSGSFLGVHFTPLTFALVPLYRAFPYAETLFIVQNGTLAIASIFIYLIALHVSRHHFASLVFQITFLINPLTLSAVMFPFHIEVFVPLFGLMALYYLEKRKLLQLAVSLILLTLTIDFAIFIAGAIALYTIIKLTNRKERLVGLVLLIYTTIMIFVAIKAISMFGPEPLSFGGLFDDLGSNWREIIVNALTKPYLLLKAMSRDLLLKAANLFILLIPYLPTIFNNLISWIPASPYIIVSFLTSRASMYTPGWHIQVLFGLPFIAYAGIKGFEAIIRSKCSNIWSTISKVLLFSILMALLSLALSSTDFIQTIASNSPLGVAYVSKPEFGEKVMFLHEVLRYVPPNASILAQNHIFPHVANRVDAYVWIPPNTTVDLAIADLTQHDYYTKHGDVPFAKQFETLLEQGYKLCVYGYGVMLLAKDSCPIKKLVPFKATYNYENIIAGSYEVVSINGFKALKYIAKSPTFVYGPYITLPPGTYNVVFWIMIKDIDFEGYVATVDVATDQGRAKLVSRPIYTFELKSGEFIPINITFYTPNVLHLAEFRVVGVSSKADGKLYLGRIEVQQVSLDREIKQFMFLTHKELVPNVGVEDGIIIRRPGDRHDVVWFGPYASLKAGEYVAYVKISVSNITSLKQDIIMQVDVVVERGVKRLALFNITKDTVKDGQWITLPLRFTLDKDYNDVEIRGLNVAKDVCVKLAYILLVREG
jgi:uncharacterized membrane protein